MVVEAVAEEKEEEFVIDETEFVFVFVVEGVLLGGCSFFVNDIAYSNFLRIL